MILAAQIALLAIAVFCLGFVVMHIRAGFRTRLILFAFLTLGLLCGCGPVKTPPPSPSFVVVIHNDLAAPELVDLSWRRGATVGPRARATIPAGGWHSFFVGFTPDMVELDSAAFPAQSGGKIWQAPDYWGFYVFHVRYPSGATWCEYPVK
jgi:hypothetical protein